MSENFQSFLNAFLNFESRLHQTSLQEFSLDPIRKALERLGRPDKQLKVIHVAGTKGKGSTSMMIASVLREAGYSVGLYTSPHLCDLNERIRILRPRFSLASSLSKEGEPLSVESAIPPLVFKEGARGSSLLFSDSITDEQLMDVILHTRSVIEDVHRSSSRGLTFFEVLTIMAVCHFARQRVDWVVLETGLGGRLDATNAIDSVAAVITPVSLDHQNILGATISEIAAEKAGIIKASSQKVILAHQPDEAADVFRKRCEELGIEPVWAADYVQAEFAGYRDGRQALNFRTPSCGYQNVSLSLAGPHQRENAATALCTAEILKVSFAAGRLDAAWRDLFWPGRFEMLSRRPTIVLDCAHNESSLQTLMRSLEECLAGRECVFVFGCSQDKNLRDMIRLLKDRAKYVILTQADHPRAHAFTSREADQWLGQKATIVPGVDEALKQAREMADDVIVVTGSVFVVAQARKSLHVHL